MFESVKIPKKLSHSPIDQAIFEIRYEGNYPGEALYGMLFDVFSQFPNKDMAELPIMQLPKHIRDNDPNLRYEAFYRVANDKNTFSAGSHSFVFSALKPYSGWADWKQFFKPIIKILQKKNIIKTVERIGLRYINIFNTIIFDKVNAGLTIAGNSIILDPGLFRVEFDQSNIHTILNVSNTIIMNDAQKQYPLIDVDCINTLDYEAQLFFSSYENIIDETHQVNKNVFFGLLKENFLNSFEPEY
jgi:uncharacterized protein (TIGR04255 family)